MSVIDPEALNLTPRLTPELAGSIDLPLWPPARERRVVELLEDRDRTGDAAVYAYTDLRGRPKRVIIEHPDMETARRIEQPRWKPLGRGVLMESAVLIQEAHSANLQTV